MERDEDGDGFSAVFAKMAPFGNSSQRSMEKGKS
jgi:hypothetical protein